MVKLALIDDDELANELVTFILELAGIDQYDLFTSGEEALEFLSTCRNENDFPKIIFVDINMPGMDGFEFIKQYELHHMPYSPETKIIMLTNSILANERKEAGKYKSVYGFWNKPLTPERLKMLMEVVYSENK